MKARKPEIMPASSSRKPLHVTEHNRLITELEIIDRDLRRIRSRLVEAYGMTAGDALGRAQGNVMGTRNAIVQRWHAVQPNGGSPEAPAVLPVSP